MAERTIYLKWDKGTSKLMLQEGNKEAVAASDAETYVDPGDKITWTLSKESHIDNFHGIRYRDVVNSTDILVDGTTSDKDKEPIYPVDGSITAIVESKSRKSKTPTVEYYEIGIIVQSESKVKWIDPKLKMNI